MTKENIYSDIVLGFAEEALPETRDPENFASKAGGLPVWLYRPPARPPKVPRCKVCLLPQSFLLQIYCPLEAEVVDHANAFHRILYVSICKQSSCQRHTDCVSVIRAQLPRDNRYYGWDGGSCLEEGEKEECELCGFWGQQKCGGCGLRYCGRVCQTHDWKLGHRECCKAGGRSDELETKRKRDRFAEIEIVTDNHPTPHSSDLEDEEDEGVDEGVDEGADEGEAEVEAEDDATAGIKGTMQDADAEELPEDLFRGKQRKDKAFEQMRQMMKYAPDQVIRYWRGGETLWGGEEKQCKNILNCDRCGGPRRFEFQIMPQLVYYLNRREAGQTIERIARRMRDEMDWLTIAIYTCAASCGEDENYYEEFAWVQTVC